MPIPVQRAETYYLPPPSLPRTAWDAIPPAERVLRWWEHRHQRRIAVPTGVLLGTQVFARIDANRWVADCACMSAQVVTPTDPRMACPECGAGWWQLTFPADVDAAEASVAEQLPGERFWWNPEDESAWNRPADDDAPADPEVPEP